MKNSYKKITVIPTITVNYNKLNWRNITII